MMSETNADLPLVAVIILNWADEAATIACVRSVQASTYRNTHIYVVDNGATAQTQVALAEIAPLVEMIPLAENQGYTGGNNAAMRRALETNAKYCILLNNDAVMPPDTLEKLVAEAELHPEFAIVSPMIREAGRDTYEVTGYQLALNGRSVINTTDPEESQRWQRESPKTFLFVGTAMMIRTDVLRQVGLLDERLFAYCEDADICLRCIEAGYLIRVLPDCEVLHEPKPAIRKPHGYYFMNRNPFLLSIRRSGLLGYARCLVTVGHRMLRDVRRFGPDHIAQAEAGLLGWWDGIWMRTGAYDPSRRAPRWLAWPMLRYPGVFLKILDLV